ncbi:hypothetical protein C2E23DRAFT_861945 [Lenzites betulinus]|nr:hypothetical protein C2E23DRAFT_861945 [Lenzites betulinus]
MNGVPQLPPTLPPAPPRPPRACCPPSADPTPACRWWAGATGLSCGGPPSPSPSLLLPPTSSSPPASPLPLSPPWPPLIITILNAAVANEAAVGRPGQRRLAEKADIGLCKTWSSSHRYAAKAAALPTPDAICVERIAKGCFVAKYTPGGCHKLSIGLSLGWPHNPGAGGWAGSYHQGVFWMAQGSCLGQCGVGQLPTPLLHRGFPLAVDSMHRVGSTIQWAMRQHLRTYAMTWLCNALQALETIFKRNPALQHPSATSTYPAASFNFGPDAFCVGHTDGSNNPINWIHITALGTFNPTTGGHLILYDLRLVIRFPPGSSILFPSAILCHGNVAVAKHEHCMSLT